VNTPAKLDATMQIASVSETVNVEADVVKINTVDASVGNSFHETQRACRRNWNRCCLRPSGSG
jgi:hypothetical protein